MTLHLDSLYISGFRGIPKLEIPRLGRVTLLAGKNGVGKTTALDAVRMYAGRSRYGVIAAILRRHGELRRVTDLDGAERQDPNWPALFYGRDQWLESGIRIGPYDACRQMAAHAVWIDIAQTKLPPFSQILGHEILALDVAYGEQRWVVPIGHPLPDFPGRRFRSSEYEPPQEIGCESLGPGLLDALTLARFWDDVVIRNEQSLAVDALNLILDAPAEGIAVVGDALQRGSDRGRRVIVQIAGEKATVPLQSLGDGVARLFGVAVALVNSRDGFLLIDEAENGIHHSVQQDFWRLVLLAAQQHNVQVLATTHSWDCVVGFAKAASNLPDIEGMLYRLQRNGQRLRAVEYPESELMIAANYNIEVR